MLLFFGKAAFFGFYRVLELKKNFKGNLSCRRCLRILSARRSIAMFGTRMGLYPEGCRFSCRRIKRNAGGIMPRVMRVGLLAISTGMSCALARLSRIQMSVKDR